ncbi:hypothetical protein [Mycolicibacterium fallax]|uniref:Uncharacterized protein n=1 Tax=Mycolicibacterium fallax TaxID=1793 RepID=A0A1X1RNF8_MYCFA|nr:hypothetical protein [Mycolicibacterium fallax]ORV10037.1 hypothetical protein AWC04_01015 [Mycolicibacterium fallax]BBY98344.1 hypothetical protein MFAL_18110 [Mycolicibacterium fallax]
MTEDELDHIRRRFSRIYSPFIDVGKGWYLILIELDAELATIDPDLRYVQIKERFGELRTYTTRACPETWNRVRDAKLKAREKAAVTCESCGRTGTLHVNTGWYRTLCPSCAAEADYVSVQQ